MTKVLFSIFSFTVFLTIGLTSATADSDDNDTAMNDYHNIEQGDILWEIANRYHVSIDEVGTRQQLLEEGITVNNESEEDQEVKSADTKSSEDSEDNVVKEVNVTATAYTAYCEGCIGITKTGVDLIENPDARVIAVDPSVIPLGSKVYVEGYGYARAEDTGGAIKGNRIDIYMEKEKDALKYGVQDVKVKIIEE
ncbi:3D domain-containing protein [Rossellomorea aquimaris]|uniref:3D domain-containing protein n=1 Tax=Rossellomorea aquimaris TaxID=189382 RepID=UPI0005CA1E89|nr:3D domain-containing protein [Rossellomorea aquimaris]